MKLRRGHRVIDIETGRKGVVFQTTKKLIYVDFTIWKGFDHKDQILPNQHVERVIYAKESRRLARQYARPPKPKAVAPLPQNEVLPL